MNFEDLLRKINELDTSTTESMQPPVQAVMAGPSKPEMPMDELSAIRHLSGQPVAEWDTDPDEERAQRADALDAAIESVMDNLGINPEDITPENLEEIAEKISATYGTFNPYSNNPNDRDIPADQVADWLESRMGTDEGADQPQFDIPDDDVLLGDEPPNDKLLGEVPADEQWSNSPEEKLAKLAAVISTGDDLSSKGKEAPKVNGGGNPMQESLVEKLSAMYEEVKTRQMSRAAKGNRKYGKDGMAALRDAAADGASEAEMDEIRDEHNRYKKK